jgi:SagB-type dehydrogenase family enzyme
MTRKVMVRITAVFLLFIPLFVGGVLMVYQPSQFAPPQAVPQELIIELPSPVLAGEMSLEQTLYERRSIRAYRDEPLSLAQLSQLLWAAQGITNAAGHRTAASAGALYPLETLAVVGNVSGLEPGVYRYHPAGHSLSLVAAGDKRADLSAAALNQGSVAQSAVVLVLSGIYERTTGKYGQRGEQYVHMEVGIAYQNAHLQAVALGLGAVYIGAFDDARVGQLLHLGEGERPFCLLPVGWPDG